jgi:hypothetical protein
MVIFNHDEFNNLELLINTCYKSNSNIIEEYFYDLKKKISITGIFHLYNNSNKPIMITCFILKKPFWHK